MKKCNILCLIDKSKQHKGKPQQQYPNMFAGNFRPQLPVIPPFPTFDDMKAFGPAFAESSQFPSFGGKGIGSSLSSFGTIGGFGGIKNKLSMLLGGKFGKGSGGGLLGSLGMGWD